MCSPTCRPRCGPRSPSASRACPATSWPGSIEPTTTSLLTAGAEPARRSIERPAGVDDATVVAAVAAWLGRVTSAPIVALEVTDDASCAALAAIAPLGRPGVATFEVAQTATFGDVAARAAAELELVATREPLLRDAIGRDPRTRGHDLTVPVRVDIGADAPASDSLLRVAVAPDAIVLEAAL